ncbi:MAG: ComEA family DNA-binding protein [Tepidisphaeraceae bacterium]
MRAWAARHLTYLPAQRRVLPVLLAVLLIGLSIRACLHRSYIADPPAAVGDRATDLADRLDPNTADWSELAALPLIGEKRAKALVARRERLLAKDPGAIVYRRPEDLFYVDGFGPAVVEQLKPYLMFPKSAPSTVP